MKKKNYLPETLLFSLILGQINSYFANTILRFCTVYVHLGVNWLRINFRRSFGGIYDPYDSAIALWRNIGRQGK